MNYLKKPWRAVEKRKALMVGYASLKRAHEPIKHATGSHSFPQMINTVYKVQNYPKDERFFTTERSYKITAQQHKEQRERLDAASRQD